MPTCLALVSCTCRHLRRRSGRSPITSISCWTGKSALWPEFSTASAIGLHFSDDWPELSAGAVGGSGRSPMSDQGRSVRSAMTKTVLQAEPGGRRPAPPPPPQPAPAPPPAYQQPPVHQPPPVLPAAAILSAAAVPAYNRRRPSITRRRPAGSRDARRAGFAWFTPPPPPPPPSPPASGGRALVLKRDVPMAANVNLLLEAAGPLLLLLGRLRTCR